MAKADQTSSTSFFQDAAAYEHLMGRWSRRLAPSLIQFGGFADGERVLDAGCGTGCLTLALPDFANFASITGIDITEPYVEAARSSNADPRIAFEVGDVLALPYSDAAFDRAYSCLVLHFIPEAARAVTEMRRVVRPGGMATAAIWDILRPRENPQTPHLKRPLISRPTRQPFFGFSRGQSITTAASFSRALCGISLACLILTWNVLISDR